MQYEKNAEGNSFVSAIDAVARGKESIESIVDISLAFPSVANSTSNLEEESSFEVSYTVKKLHEEKPLFNFCEQNGAVKVAVRPFIRIRAVNDEMHYAKLAYLGDLIKGPCSYDRKAINHKMIADAYFQSNLGIVSIYLYFFKAHK